MIRPILAALALASCAPEQTPMSNEDRRIVAYVQAECCEPNEQDVQDSAAVCVLKLTEAKCLEACRATFGKPEHQAQLRVCTQTVKRVGSEA